MANELKLTTSIVFSKGTEKAQLVGTSSVSVTGTHYVQSVQDVGTSEETVVKGDIGTIGWVAFHNLDATNFIEIGSSTGVYAIKLLAGQYAGPMPWDAANVLAKADTATVKLEYLMVEL